MYSLKALPKFLRQFSRFSPADRKKIKEGIRKIAENPSKGKIKKGPLSGIRVYKWKLKHQLYLIAYEFDKKEKTVFLYAIAVHEGFYKALKRYI